LHFSAHRQTRAVGNAYFVVKSRRTMTRSFKWRSGGCVGPVDLSKHHQCQRWHLGSLPWPQLTFAFSIFRQIFQPFLHYVSGIYLLVLKGLIEGLLVFNRRHN
jgi:hypothetical protein